ncbi:hypothetical protein [Blautia producta]|uniref:hypothetical protein n=1 Tax=Blautia producta TaxID=33035 RepID=UPI00356A43A0
MSKQQKDFIKALLGVVFWFVVGFLFVIEPAFGTVGVIIGLASLVWGKIKNKSIVTFKIKK